LRRPASLLATFRVRVEAQGRRSSPRLASDARHRVPVARRHLTIDYPDSPDTPVVAAIG
jgi:hypothetical protein